jgi:hypothetical protein
MNTRNGRSSEVPKRQKVKNILLNNKENEKIFMDACHVPDLGYTAFHMRRMQHCLLV